MIVELFDYFSSRALAKHLTVGVGRQNGGELCEFTNCGSIFMDEKDKEGLI